MTIQLSTIVVPPRLRLDYGGEKLEDLKESLTTYGQLQSLLIDDANNLIAGGRRLAAMTELGWTSCEVMVQGNLSLTDRLKRELEENFRRLDMSWQEKALSVSRIHRELKLAEPNSRWGMRETGEMIGVHFSRVSKLSAVARCLSTDPRDTEMWEARDVNDALRILIARKETEGAKRLKELEDARKEREARKKLSAANPKVDIDKILAGDPTNGKAAEVVVDLSSHFLLGDCLEILPQLSNISLDHVITDIPYGIDMVNLSDMSNIDIIADQHDVEQNLSMFEPFLRESFRILRPNGFCIFWYDLEHHEVLRTIAKKVGFKLQDWPLLWCKTHACKNMASSQNWTKATEAAMVCRKGNASLLKQQPTNYILASSAEDRKKYDNPFAKPKVLWDWLYNAVAAPGQSVLDPFAGEGSSALSAIALGLQPLTIEISPLHHERSIQHIQRLYKQIYKGRVRFV